MKFAASATKFCVRRISRPMHSNRAVRLATLFQVALMIIFRAPKFRRRLNLRDDRTIKATAHADFFFGSFGRGFLLEGMIKNYGSILRPDIRTLSIQRGLIVIRRENVEQLTIADWRGIEFELENLCMPSRIRANVLVTWVLFGPARIADRGRRHALQFPKSFLHAPKTTGPECRFLCWHR